MFEELLSLKIAWLPFCIAGNLPTSGRTPPSASCLNALIPRFCRSLSTAAVGLESE